MKRAALYIRVSTEEQARNGLSLDDQKNTLEQYAKSHGFIVSGIYEDAGISARKPYKKRPALLRLLDDVKEKKIDLILFTKLDRWFRNVGNYYAVQDILDTYGVHWKAILEDYETITSSGRLKVNIMLSVAQDEADRTGERIKFTFAEKRARNEPVSGHVPTGYMIQDKRVVKDPALEPAISAFFDYYIKYGGVSKAIDYVAETYGFRMQYQLASMILEKRAYCGDFNGISCPAYITEAQHEYIISSRTRYTRKTKYNNIYLFSGLVVCGECGRRMIHRMHKYKNRQNAECNCAGHYQRAGCPNKSNIRETEIEQYLLDNIESFLGSMEAIYNEQIRAMPTRDISSEISALRRKLLRLKDLYINELIEISDYKMDFSKYTQEILRLEKIRDSAPKSLDNIKKIVCTGWKNVYQELERQQKRAFWRAIIKEIRVYSEHRIEFDFLTT